MWPFRRRLRDEPGASPESPVSAIGEGQPESHRAGTGPMPLVLSRMATVGIRRFESDLTTRRSMVFTSPSVGHLIDLDGPSGLVMAAAGPPTNVSRQRSLPLLAPRRPWVGVTDGETAGEPTDPAVSPDRDHGERPRSGSGEVGNAPVAAHSAPSLPFIPVAQMPLGSGLPRLATVAGLVPTSASHAVRSLVPTSVAGSGERPPVDAQFWPALPVARLAVGDVLRERSSPPRQPETGVGPMEALDVPAASGRPWDGETKATAATAATAAPAATAATAARPPVPGEGSNARDGQWPGVVPTLKSAGVAEPAPAPFGPVTSAPAAGATGGTTLPLARQHVAESAALLDAVTTAPVMSAESGGLVGASTTDPVLVAVLDPSPGLVGPLPIALGAHPGPADDDDGLSPSAPLAFTRTVGAAPRTADRSPMTPDGRVGPGAVGPVGRALAGALPVARLSESAMNERPQTSSTAQHVPVARVPEAGGAGGHRVGLGAPLPVGLRPGVPLARLTADATTESTDTATASTPLAPASGSHGRGAAESGPVTDPRVPTAVGRQVVAEELVNGWPARSVQSAPPMLPMPSLSSVPAVPLPLARLAPDPGPSVAVVPAGPLPVGRVASEPLGGSAKSPARVGSVGWSGSPQGATSPGSMPVTATASLVGGWAEQRSGLDPAATAEKLGRPPRGPIAGPVQGPIGGGNAPAVVGASTAVMRQPALRQAATRRDDGRLSPAPPLVGPHANDGGASSAPLPLAPSRWSEPAWPGEEDPVGFGALAPAPWAGAIALLQRQLTAHDSAPARPDGGGRGVRGWDDDDTQPGEDDGDELAGASRGVARDRLVASVVEQVERRQRERLDEHARWLWPRMRSLLAAELRLDRERSGRTRDRIC